MRIPMKVLATAVAVGALAVAGCGSDDGGGGGSSGGGGGGGKKLKVAILLPGSASDQGYNADGKRTAEALKKELGAEVTFTEAVQIPNQTDVYRQYASQGNDLVIGWGTQFTEGAVAAAKEFPKVKFFVVNATAKNGTNLGSMDTKIEQWQFFAGFIAAKMSKNGTVGFVGGQCFPATAANLHGTEQGAKYANPKVKFLSQFTGDFEDPTKAKTTASAFIDQGATALTGNVNNGWAGIYDAAKAGGNLPIVTEWADNHTQAPDVIASSVLKSQSKFIVQIAKSVQDGTFKGDMTLFPLPKDWGPVISDTDLLPDDIYKEAIALQDKVASGEIKVKRDETCPK
jgi:basic membrane protein A